MSNTKRGKKPLLIITSNKELAQDTPMARFVTSDGRYPETEGFAAVGIIANDTPKGEYAPITTHGIEFITVQETVTQGDILTTGTDGKAKKQTDNNFVMGVALDSGNDGDTIRIKL